MTSRRAGAARRAGQGLECPHAAAPGAVATLQAQANAATAALHEPTVRGIEDIAARQRPVWDQRCAGTPIATSPPQIL